jgi:hypothetical protein
MDADFIGKFMTCLFYFYSFFIINESFIFMLIYCLTGQLPSYGVPVILIMIKLL